MTGSITADAQSTDDEVCGLNLRSEITLKKSINAKVVRKDGKRLVMAFLGDIDAFID